MLGFQVDPERDKESSVKETMLQYPFSIFGDFQGFSGEGIRVRVLKRN